jgi:hypothetical protein
MKRAPASTARPDADVPLSGEWRWRHLPARADGQAAVGTYTYMESATLDVPDGYSRWPDFAPDPSRSGRSSAAAGCRTGWIPERASSTGAMSSRPTTGL